MKQEIEEPEIEEVSTEEVSNEETGLELGEKKVMNSFQRRKELNTEYVEIVQSGIDPSNLNAMKQLEFYWAQGLLPEVIDTPEKAVTIYLYAQEIGIPGILTAFNLLYIYKRKVNVNGMGLAFLIRQAGHGFEIIRDYEAFYETKNPAHKHAVGHANGEFVRRNEEGKIDLNGELNPLQSDFVGGTIIGTTIAFWRKEDPTKFQYCSFTNIDAKRSELDKQDTFKKYPSEMYYWKALSHGAKRFFNDVITGVNLPDVPKDLADLQVSNSPIDNE